MQNASRFYCNAISCKCMHVLWLNFQIAYLSLAHYSLILVSCFSLSLLWFCSVIFRCAISKEIECVLPFAEFHSALYFMVLNIGHCCDSRDIVDLIQYNAFANTYSPYLYCMEYLSECVVCYYRWRENIERDREQRECVRSKRKKKTEKDENKISTLERDDCVIKSLSSVRASFVVNLDHFTLLNSIRERFTRNIENLFIFSAFPNGAQHSLPSFCYTIRMFHL